MSKVLVNDSSLSAIGDAIREKNGEETKYKPSEMAEAISAIEGGGGDLYDYIPEEAFTITGNVSYAFSSKVFNWFLNKYGNKITTNYLTDISYMFYNNSSLKEILFDINGKEDVTQNCTSMFQGCTLLQKLSHIKAYPERCNYMFYGCNMLKELPEDLGSDWNWYRIHTYQYAQFAYLFQNCFSLREIPQSFLSNLWSTSNSQTLYPYTFYCCYTLNEILNIPIHQGTLTSNYFNSTFDYCSHVKDITFETNEDGSAKTANWTKQTINLSNYVGQPYNNGNMVNYNSGITEDKKVSNDENYQALKDDPDWFPNAALAKGTYSRYDHDSAVRTINSLPDTSAYLATAGGTNTIKFLGNNGNLTDAGAINTLTEEEIAVATAKGWTVTIS